MPIALVYARASRDPNDQRISVDRQLDLCSARAVELWPDAEIVTYRDDNLSAADPTVHRPGYAALVARLRASKPGEVAGLVVNEQSRLTRQPTEWEALVVTLTKAGLEKVETRRAGPIAVTEGTRTVGRILAIIDAEEAERTRARVRDAHRALFREGRPSGRPGYGYRSALDADGRKARVIDPDEAAVVRGMFEEASRGVAMTAIADALNERNVPPPAARWRFRDPNRAPITRWRPGAVRGVLTSPSVAGLRGHTDDAGELHLVPATWEPIIDEETWRAVQRTLGQPATVESANGNTYRVRSPRILPRRRYLLSKNVLVCSKCGSLLVAQTQPRRDGQRIPAYQCHPKGGDPTACGGISIGPADAVEAHVVAAIQSRVRSPKVRRMLAASTDADATKLRAVRDAAKADMLDASQLKGGGTIGLDEFRVMHDAAKARFDHATASLAALTATDDLPGSDEITERWDELTIAQQRAVVERLVASIDVAPGGSGRPGLHIERLGVPVWRV